MLKIERLKDVLSNVRFLRLVQKIRGPPDHLEPSADLLRKLIQALFFRLLLTNWKIE